MHHATVVHQLQGRLRMRVPLARNDREFFARVRQLFGNMPGIRTVETNYVTGSILLLHATDLKDIEDAAAREGLFQIDRQPQPLPVTAQLQEGFSSIESRLSRFTGKRIDFEGAAVLLLIGSGFVQLLRRNVWPAGATLFWYAATMLKQSKHPGQLDVAFGGTPTTQDYIQ